MKPARQTRATPRACSTSRERAVVGVAIGIVPRAAGGRASIPASRARCRPGAAGAVRDDDGDGRVEPPRRDGVDDRLQVAAASGDQDADRARPRRGVTRTAPTRSPATTKPTRNAFGSPPSISVFEHPLGVARRADDDQADAHVEGAEHLVARDRAALLHAAGRAAAPTQRLRSISAAQPSGRIARQILGDAAAGDVRHPLDPVALEQRPHQRRGTTGAAPAARRRPSCRAPDERVRLPARPSRRARGARASSRWCAGRPTAARSARRPARSPGRR